MTTTAIHYNAATLLALPRTERNRILVLAAEPFTRFAAVIYPD